MDGCFILKIYCLTLKDTNCKLVNFLLAFAIKIVERGTHNLSKILGSFPVHEVIK